MGILKKRGRPSKAEEIAKKEQEEAEELSAKKVELETLRERLKGQTIIYLRDQLNITFTIERVTFLYDGVCLSDGTPDGCSLTLLREELGQLLRYGTFARDKRDGEKDTTELFILVQEDGQLFSTQGQAVDFSEVEVAQPPFSISSEGTGEPSQKDALEVKGLAIVLRGVGDVENAFLGMMDDLKDHGCAPMLVHRASKAADRLYEALYDMEKWYREKEGRL